MSAVVGRAMSSTRRHYPRPSKPQTPALARRPVIVTVVVLFVASVAYNLRRAEHVQPAPQVEERAAEVSLMLAVELVEAYRDEHGELPQSLSDVGLSDEQYQYQRGGDGRFELEATVSTQSLRYDSSEGPEGLLRMMTSTSGGGR